MILISRVCDDVDVSVSADENSGDKIRFSYRFSIFKVKVMHNVRTAIFTVND